MTTIDLNIQLSLRDAHRRFELDARLRSEADFIVLYGPSGSGKTTTLQAVAGLQRPHGGYIRVGDDVFFDAGRGLELPARQRRIGYLFQQYALFPHLTVRANVQFGLTRWYRRRTTPAQRERVDAALQAADAAGEDDNIERVRAVVQELADATDAFAARRMDRSIRAALAGRNIADLGD